MENNSLTFKHDNLVNVPFLCKYFKLILTQVIYNIDYFCFSGKIIVLLISSKPVESPKKVLIAS